MLSIYTTRIMQNVTLVSHKKNDVKFNYLVFTMVIPKNCYSCRQPGHQTVTCLLTNTSCQPFESGKECVARQIYNTKLQCLKG